MKSFIESKSVELTIQALIVLSLISFSISTLPDLSYSTRKWLYYSELITVIIFTIEYIIRLSVYGLRYAITANGIIDLLAILPFYISTTVDLRSVRAFRLLRLIRVFKIARYSTALERLRDAFFSVRQELVLFSLMTGIVIFLASCGIYYFENPAQPEIFKSVFHSMWWAVATLTTVGYGDIYPITAGGKIFTFFILIAGLGIVAVPTGLLASALAKLKNK